MAATVTGHAIITLKRAITLADGTKLAAGTKLSMLMPPSAHGHTDMLALLADYQTQLLRSTARITALEAQLAQQG